MIIYKKGNILESEAEALVNTVNTQGVMGKGIALQFKNAFPSNYKVYQDICRNGNFQIGDLLIVEENGLISGKKTIINFPTKTSWRKPSEYSYIEKGLEKLVQVIEDKKFNSIAIPPLGSGNGGLNWEIVKKMIEDKMSHLPIDVFIYEPNSQITEKLKEERVQLTDARAMLLFMLYKLVANGEFVSEFSSEKICYFFTKIRSKRTFQIRL